MLRSQVKGSLPISNSPEHFIHLGELLGHFRVIWSMLMATVIHPQEVGNQ